MDEYARREANRGTAYDIEWPVDAGVDARDAHERREAEEPPSPLPVGKPDDKRKRKEPRGVAGREG